MSDGIMTTSTPEVIKSMTADGLNTQFSDSSKYSSQKTKRLIDANELSDIIRSLTISVGGKNMLDKAAKETILRIIDDMPTEK